MRDRILFYLNGQRVEVGGDDVFLNLSDYLRKRRGLTGTKVVCAEGDCGSCTVLVGKPNAKKIHYRPVTSCIQILFQLDAAHVVTVEGLREGNRLNPIQQAMVDCHGTQCGFCTPGFVVVLHSLMTDGKKVTDETIRRGLTGNLCRCTGYDSIIQAALSVDQSLLKAVDGIFSAAEIHFDLWNASKGEVSIETPTHRFYKPVTVSNAARFRLENPGCAVVAGGTDLGVVYNKRLFPIQVALSLAVLAPQTSSVNVDSLSIGAGCSLTSLKELADDSIPELGRFMERFGSSLIRNAGTVGGNIITGSPIGDLIPALIVLGAELELQGVQGSRVVPIGNFYTGYRQTVLAADELLTHIRIPLVFKSQTFKLYKISRRRDLDISSFSAAIWMEQSNGVIAEIRLAFGGVGPVVMRLPATEAMLRGKSPTLEHFQQAAAVAREEVKPIGDVRGSAEYRRTLAQNILIRFWHEVSSDISKAPDVHPGLRSG